MDGWNYGTVLSLFLLLMVAQCILWKTIGIVK